MHHIKLSTRMPVDRLRLGDFEKYTVWEYASDEESEPGQDETWVKPVKPGSVRNSGDAQLVAAHFLLGSGAAREGFVVVYPKDGSYECRGGVVLGRGKYLFLPLSVKKRKGIFFSEDLLVTRCKDLNVSVDQLEQTVFRLRVVLPGESRARVEYLYAKNA